MARHSRPPLTSRAAGIARAVVALGSATVAVVVDADTALIDALTARGITVVTGDGPVPPGTVAVVRADRDDLDEVLAKLGADVTRVLLWLDGDVDVAQWLAAAAASGYFRSTELLLDVFGVTCVLVVAGELTPAEIVARYETVLAGTPTQAEQLRSLRHELLTSHDHAIGAEAELGRARALNTELDGQIRDIYATTTWRVGSRLVGPLGRVKRTVQK